MSRSPARNVAFATAVHIARFVVIMGGLTIGPLIGITGWYIGLFVNVLCAVFAAGLVTYLGLWDKIGFAVAWRGRAAALLLLVPLAEAVLWLVPGGLDDRAPGFALWAVSLLLVGFNEELTSRGVVLERLRNGSGRHVAVALTAALFGLQHLSAFATTSRGAYDVLTNVLVSACYGFALAAFQWRYAWIWPLILLHAFADFTTILSADGHSDTWIAVTVVVFVAFGLLVLRSGADSTIPEDCGCDHHAVENDGHRRHTAAGAVARAAQDLPGRPGTSGKA